MRLLLPLALGVTASLAQRFADPLPDLLRCWKRHGFVANTTAVGIEGRLLDIETLPERRVALLVRLGRFELPGRPPFRGRPGGPILLRLTAPVPGEPDLFLPRPGDSIEVDARVGPPRTFRNPGAFDYAAYLKARGVDLVGAIKSHRLIRTVPGRSGNCAALPSRARSLLLRTLERAAGDEDDATVSFLAALLVGERGELPPDLEERLIRAGVYHIVALSGFNVALIVGLVSALFRLLPLGPQTRRLLLGPCTVLYWGVAQPSGSIARAALMTLLSLGGALLGRRVSGMGAIASSCVLILAVNPAWSRDPGFQLSFAATLGLLLLVPPMNLRGAALPSGDRMGPLRAGARRIRGWLVGSLGVSAAALLSTALVSARHFQTLTPVALVANLFAVPIAALLLVMGLMVCVLEPLAHPVAGALLGVSRALVDLLQRLSAAVAAPEGCSFSVLPPPVWLVLLGQSAIVLAGHGRAILRRAALLFLTAAIAVTVLAGRASSPPGGLEVIVLDVGQGDALLVRFPDGPTMLIDAGGFARTRFDVGAKVVAPALRALGILRLDLLAITHAHRDHLGGAWAILRSFSPGAVWLGRMPGDDAAVAALEGAAALRHIPVVFPRRGVRILVGGAVVEVLNPGLGVETTGPARNDDSLVLRISFRGRSALLTGDLEAALETFLVREGRDLRADLLKVGHHGSRTSTTASFLGQVRPRLGAISVGATNPWGHPDEEVVKRLEDAGADVYRTDRDGAVDFVTDGVLPWRPVRLTEGETGAASGLRTGEGSPE